MFPSDDSAYSKVKLYKFYPQLIENLIENHAKDTSELKDKVNFWSQFLESSLLGEMLDSNSSMTYAPEERTDSVQSYNSNTDATPGHKGLQYLNAYGYGAPKIDKKVKTKDFGELTLEKSNSDNFSVANTPSKLKQSR